MTIRGRDPLEVGRMASEALKVLKEITIFPKDFKQSRRKSEIP